MKKIIQYIFIIILLIITMLIVTGCGKSSNDNENEVKMQENITNTATSENEIEGIEVGDNLLKYGTYEGIELAKGSSIILNEDGTFLYKDEATTGEGTYEVKNQEIDDIEGSYNAWVIEFDSLEKVSNGKIPGDFYRLFTQTGDISEEQGSINFNYKE